MALILVLSVTTFSLCTLFLQPKPAQAVSTIPQKINFQGRLTDASGNILPDGTYNVKFKIYDAASGGTLKWSEDWVGGNRIQVTNGLFTVQLGSITSMSSIQFSTFTPYLEIELPTPATATSASPVWTEGPMTPRQPFGSAAYAFNAEQLDGLDSSQFARSDANNTLTGTNAINNTSTTAFQIQNASAAGNLFIADTTNTRVGIGTAPTLTTDILQVAGSIYTNTSLKVGSNTSLSTTSLVIGGTTVCNSTGCTAAASSGSYIQNTTTLQTGGANFAISNAGATTAITALIKQSASQTGDLIQLQNSSASPVASFSPSGQLKIGSAAAYTSVLNIGTNTTTAAGGITFGTDANLYRSGAGQLTTTSKLGVGLAPSYSFQVGVTNAYGFSVDTSSAVPNVAIGTTPNANVLLNIGGTGLPTSFASASAVTGLGVVPVNGSTGDIYGIQAGTVSTTAGTVATQIGAYTYNRVANAGLTLQNAYNYYAQSPIVSSGAITTSYGVYINTQKVAGVTTGYGVYQGGAADINYFAGKVGIGTGASAATALNIINTVTDPGTTQYGTNSIINTNQTAANANALYGVNGAVNITGTGGNTGIVTGINGLATYNAAGTGTNINGGEFLVNQGTSGGGISVARGSYNRVDNANTTNAIVTAYGLQIASNIGAGSITNNIGLRVDALAGTSSAYGIQIAAPTGAGTKAAINLADTGGTSAGGLLFGTDTTLYRSAADTLKTDDSFIVAGTQLQATQISATNQILSSRTSAGGSAYQSTVTGDALARFVAQAGGTLQWGDGTNAVDTNLYRSAADTLKTDDSLIVGGDLTSGNQRTISLTRTVPTVVNDEVDLGTFTISSGAGSLQVNVAVSSGGFSVAKSYTIPVAFNGTGGAWTVALPSNDTGAYGGNNFAIDVLSSAGTVSLRLRRISGATAGSANISINATTLPSATFAASTATSSVAAPSSTYTSTTFTQASGQAIFQGTSTTAFQIQNTAGTGNLFIADTTNSRIGIGATPATSLLTIGTNTTSASGGITFGTDTSLYRLAASQLATNSEFKVIRTATTDIAFSALVSGDTTPRYVTQADGKLLWGDGTAARDTNLYRSAANLLATDDSFQLTGTGSNLTVQGTGNSSIAGNLAVSNGLTVSRNATSTDQDRVLSVSGTHSTTGAFNGAYGMLVSTTIAPAGGSVSYYYGQFLQAYASPSSSATITLLNASNARNALSGVSPTGTITNSYQLQADVFANQATGTPNVTIANQVGLKVNNQGSGSGTNGLTIQNAIGIDIAAQNTASTSNIGLRVGLASTYSLQLSDTGGTTAGGITFGTDTNLYRSAADTLKTDDSLIVAGTSTLTGAVTGASTITGTTLNGTTGINTGASAGTQRIDSSGNLVNIGSITASGTTSLTGNTTVNTGTANSLAITSGGNIPTATQLTITNVGSTGTITADANGQTISFKGGAAAVEAAGERINLTPGTTTGGIWSALRVTPAATGAVSGVTENGIKIDTLTTPGAGTENAISVGTGWDSLLNYNGTVLISGTGVLQSAAVSGSYTGITGVGALTAGSIGSGFTTISTSSTITGTTLNGTTGINTGASAGTQRIDSSGNLVNIGNITSTGTTSHTGNTTVNTGTSNSLAITSGTSVPTTDQLTINNTGSTGVITAGVNGFSINYKGGAAVVESAAQRIDIQPGTSSGGVWSGLRLVATGAATGVTENGLKIDTLATPGAGTENALFVGTGWDSILSYNGTQLLSGTGVLQSAALSGTYSNALTLSSASNSLSGSGANLTALNATNLSSGTVASARIAGSYTGITGVGALTAGSITSFGTINTGSTITGTTLNGTTGINTGAGAGTQRIDANGNASFLDINSAGAISVVSTISAGSGLYAVGTVILDSAGNSTLQRYIPPGGGYSSGQHLTTTGSTLITYPGGVNGSWTQVNITGLNLTYTPTTYALTIGNGGCFVYGFVLSSAIAPSSGGFTVYIANITGATQGACSMYINWTAARN